MGTSRLRTPSGARFIRGTRGHPDRRGGDAEKLRRPEKVFKGAARIYPGRDSRWLAPPPVLLSHFDILDIVEVRRRETTGDHNT